MKSALDCFMPGNIFGSSRDKDRFYFTTDLLPKEGDEHKNVTYKTIEVVYDDAGNISNAAFVGTTTARVWQTYGDWKRIDDKTQTIIKIMLL